MAFGKKALKTLASWKSLGVYTLAAAAVGFSFRAADLAALGAFTFAGLLAVGLVVFFAARVITSGSDKREAAQIGKFEDAEDPIAWLRSCDVNGQFVNEIILFKQAYDNAKGRELFFSKYDSDSPFKKSYDLVIAQMKSDIKSAGQFIGTYYPSSKADRSYLHALLKNTRELAAKLDQLTKAAISNESVADDVDTSYVDDLLASLKDLQEQGQTQTSA